MEKLRILTEHAFLRSPNIHVGIKAEIKGQFSDKEFGTALEQVCIRHPLLLSAISIEEDGNAFYLLNKSEKIDLEFLRNEDEDHWLNWFERTDNKHFDFEQGPLLRIGVIRKAGKSDIIIVGHHLLGDGIAYMFLLRDLLLALNGELDLTPLLPSIMKVKSEFPKKAKLGLLPRLLARKLNRSWKNNSRKFSNEEFYSFFYEYRSRNIPGLYINTLNKQKTEDIICRCRKNQITVNDALITAFLSAIQKLDGKHIDKFDEVGVAVNIRNELVPQAGESMGNFVSGIMVELKYDFSKDFMENARDIRKKLREKLKNPRARFIVLNLLEALDPELIDSICFAKYGEYDNKISRRLADIIGERSVDKGIGVSNLGRFDMTLNNSRFEINDVVFIQPAYPANDINLGVLTVNDKMSICLRYLKTNKDHELVDKIFREAMKSLHNF